MKISPDGELIWSKNFGGSWPDYGASVIELANGQLSDSFGNTIR
jgi:hypothetical protein